MGHSKNPYFFSRRVEVAALAARARLPAIYGFREHAEVGGLMSYGSNLAEAYRQAARLMAKVLKGANPAEIPVEQADRFELVVNNKTASRKKEPYQDRPAGCQSSSTTLIDR
jgi:putative tryptophan/tyrosine transport system substrate-binding protein